MEAKEGFALLCLCCCWSCWSYKAVSMSPVGRTFGDNPSAIYNHCRFTKGSPKLYNCPPDYRSPGGFANLSQPSSPRRYLIKLKDYLNSTVLDHICNRAQLYHAFCLHRYKNVWLGMLMDIAGHDLAQFVQAEANFIDHVEIEGIVKIALTQKDPPWGLDRIDHNPGEKDLNNLYNVSSSGDGVHVYVLDTGIRCTHRDFWYEDGRTDSRGRRLSRCLDGFDGIRDGGGLNDCNGHGTHCAGIVAGLQSGVAKSAFLHPIRAMACDGTGNFGAILAALEWISDNIVIPAVLSMSIATQASISIDQAVNNLVNTTGIVAVAAAGNFLDSACAYSPSRASGVISVASSNSVDSMSWFSNYGNCTAIFAPGELILSAYKDNDSSYTTLSGTSMACPHVAGAAALFLSENVDARPAEVRQSILDSSEPKAIAYVKPYTTDKLLNVHLEAPPVNVHPRSIYDAVEGSVYSILVSLKMRPYYSVTLAPYFSDSNIGYFSPSQLSFKADSTWSYVKVIKIYLATQQDFLDHKSTIQWSFTSKDSRYNLSPEGFIVSLDTGVCKFSADNPCGQYAENPKIIPSLPFVYYDDTTKYANIYDVDFDKCHSSGPDVVFQYTATANMVVNVSLCSPNTQFDSMLAVYEKKVQKRNQTAALVKTACNDDYCQAVSALSMITLLKGHVYIFMVDGYQGEGGPFDISIYSQTGY
ncbi:hypothetical protein KP509_23G050600 [Ceratopteris richardii]|uniref:Peptidase S8/S53 domain-containing protein n=1 Tax=Ceratopteris richardii TaxID=49495 RepID=A0A8T2RZQ9_CERRI|nr:hypothetical protein KP509_23G050600 [Ceratopteris richardii]KAH7301968.1 hypothetical protein KP509_23G050600 [Ceratopteris richardii]KAH7301969.1 hypothetical protein KP509_23G050600 [Ceratopteris richardii]KAH7301970.1 hypothetical protein KP509_23G050600 [Ceratopteris richardii]